MAKKKRYYANKRKSGMIMENKNAPSNCPQEVIMKEYPQNDYLNAPVYDDLYGIDMQIDGAVRKARKQMAKKKY